MRNSAFKYIVLFLFLASATLIVFVQYNSQKNNKQLIQSNKSLLNELKTQSDLHKLEADVLSIDNEIKNIVIIQSPASTISITDKLNSIKSRSDDPAFLAEKNLLSDDVSGLKKLINAKVLFTRHVLNTYVQYGKRAAEIVRLTGESQALTAGIITAINKLDYSRQSYLKQVPAAVNITGPGTKMSGLVLAVITCIACALAFLYIINKDRQQQKTISVLNESEKKIKELAQVKDQFLANMSHEIRTPINSILGFTNLLKKTNLNGTQHQYVSYINSSGENLLTLINDILDLSKIEAGMMNIEQAPFSLNGLVSSIEIMFREKAVSKGIILTVAIDHGIHDILYGDAVRLTQILTNLLSNAIKFTEKGSVKLSVHAIEQHDNIIELQFNVQDTGVGIATDKREKIFNRFQQAEEQTTRQFGGTGLGLSIVKQLVDIQNGTIRVLSEQGRGSTFLVNLPFKLIYDGVEKPVVSVNQILPGLKNIRILIAEDNLMNQQLIRHLMRQWQLKYQVVKNGQEALDVLKQTRFSIVLMDIQMPEMDGYTATLAIRNELKLNVPVIAMTAHAMPGEKERCLSFGMNDYISKPICDVDLYAILKLHAQVVDGEAAETGIINLSYLKEISMGDDEFEETIIRQFIIQVPEELKLMEAAISLGDSAMVKGLAHSMKSSVSYVGLNDRLHPVLHRIETEAATGESPVQPEDFEEVRSVCLQAVEEAKELLLQLTATEKLTVVS